VSLSEKETPGIFDVNLEWADLSDEELVARFSNPVFSERAFREIVNRYQKRVYYHVRRILIDHDDTSDVVQNTFIKVFGGMSSFRSDSKLFTWIYRISTNEALTFLKRRKLRLFLPLVDVEKELFQKLESDPLVSADKIQKKLQQAILLLPEKQRIVFHLRYYDELPYEEMSAILGTSVGALKASYHHAYKKIEKFLGTP
jgi:RNA polymerase sigma-70 factor (ECF subfamily)